MPLCVRSEEKKFFKDPISHVKFLVESKTELRIGVRNKEKLGNRKEAKILVLINLKKFKKKKIFFLVFNSFVKNAMQNNCF